MIDFDKGKPPHLDPFLYDFQSRFWITYRSVISETSNYHGIISPNNTDISNTSDHLCIPANIMISILIHESNLIGLCGILQKQFIICFLLSCSIYISWLIIIIIIFD
eukprot:TRINITY_DN2024_c0_g1_i4.p1 TRINITY_DN2024_c0_g1~~TRINITY_DN2024_c0_g1_i4.p1  ORF type:complete len:107 (-),score=5.79 TRINITY_DN2024_c0_g1_i4:6-326(-)